jgi:hypothetical protein
VCYADFRNRSWLLVWILGDYGTNNWSLKHIVDTEELFGHMNIKVGSELCDEEYRVITVHSEWNFIFLIFLFSHLCSGKQFSSLYVCIVQFWLVGMFNIINSTALFR